LISASVICRPPIIAKITVVDELRANRVKRAQELLRLWARTIRKTRLARLRFHDLRHAHATHLLANGVHPKVASERLRHSEVGITLDLYSHVIPGMQEDAAAMVDRAAARDKARK